jgi:hypothetical protein
MPIFHSVISPPLAKILTKKSFFYIHSPLKKFVLLLQLLKIFNFCLTFRWRRERTTNELFRWRNFSPAAAKYVSGKRALCTTCLCTTCTYCTIWKRNVYLLLRCHKEQPYGYWCRSLKTNQENLSNPKTRSGKKLRWFAMAAISDYRLIFKTHIDVICSLFLVVSSHAGP